MCELCEDKGWYYADGGRAVTALCEECNNVPFYAEIYHPIRQDGTIDWGGEGLEPHDREKEYALEHHPWAVAEADPDGWIDPDV